MTSFHARILSVLDGLNPDDGQDWRWEAYDIVRAGIPLLGEGWYGRHRQAGSLVFADLNLALGQLAARGLVEKLVDDDCSSCVWRITAKGRKRL